MERERFSLRHATPEDIPVLKTLFTDTVLRTNRKDYTQEEVEDWTACADKPGHWKELIATHHFTLAEEYPGHTVGFAAVRPDGYLHSMFVHHDFQRQGIASLLLEDMENTPGCKAFRTSLRSQPDSPPVLRKQRLHHRGKTAEKSHATTSDKFQNEETNRLR